MQVPERVSIRDPVGTSGSGSDREARGIASLSGRALHNLLASRNGSRSGNRGFLVEPLRQFSVLRVHVPVLWPMHQAFCTCIYGPHHQAADIYSGSVAISLCYDICSDAV